mmetsp:Transcript_33811/g.32888  ORF Transcript_33811/g.32888 Transcript_33811/m.32888 type:complete len:128 (-) Transcript_33811:743-1126(-)
MTVTDKESTTSSETLMATPTKRKRASTLSSNVLPQQQQSVKKNNSTSISNSGNKVTGKGEELKASSVVSHQIMICNHMENNFHLSNKKALFYNMKIFYESQGLEYFNILPLTFHIKEGVNDKEFAKF